MRQSAHMFNGRWIFGDFLFGLRLESWSTCCLHAVFFIFNSRNCARIEFQLIVQANTIIHRDSGRKKRASHFVCSHVCDRCLSAVYWLFDATVTACDVMVSVLFFHFSSTFCNRSISKNHLEMRRKIEKPSHVKNKDGKQFLIDFYRLLC